MNHKRITRLGTFFILAMIVVLAGAVPVAAKAERIYYSGEDCPIYVGPAEREWVSDGILHRRGIEMITTLLYEPSDLNGTNQIVANMDVDLATGAVHVYGTAELHPDEGEGTWVGFFSTHVSPEGVIKGNAVVHGTGDFEGMIGFNSISSPDVLDPACGYMNTASNGYILIPHQ